MMNVDYMPYIERVRVASIFRTEMNRLQELYEYNRGKAILFPESVGGFLHHALDAMERSKLVRLWISELHVLDRDVARFPIEFPCTCGVIVPDNVNDRCLMHQKGSMPRP